jgi:folate-binding Fe-S cluster repair protein YgfZ
LSEPVTLLRLEGADTRQFLHGQTSQAIESARPGQWLRTCCITPTARMRALAEILVDAEGAWLVISAGDGSLVRESLDRVLFPADRVRLGPSGGCPLDPAGGRRGVPPDGPLDDMGGG